MTIREHMALEIMGTYNAHDGRKANAARELVGMSEVRHAQVVDALLDRADAEAEAPMLVRRLRRVREARQRARRAR